MNAKTINSRIREIRVRFFEDSNKRFAEALKARPNTVNNWVREGYSVGRGVLSKISDTTGVSLNWLLTGEGEMLAGNIPYVENNNIFVDDISNNNPKNLETMGMLNEMMIILSRQSGQIDRLIAEVERNGNRADRMMKIIEQINGLETTQKKEAV